MEGKERKFTLPQNGNNNVYNFVAGYPPEVISNRVIIQRQLLIPARIFISSRFRNHYSAILCGWLAADKTSIKRKCLYNKSIVRERAIIGGNFMRLVRLQPEARPHVL